MRRPALACQGIRLRHPRAKVAQLVVPLAVVVWTVAAHWSAAQTPGWQQIIKNPATTLRTLAPKGQAESISEEVWIGSEEADAAGSTWVETTDSEREPVASPKKSPQSSSLSTTPGKTDFAPHILRIRVPQSTSAGKTPTEDAASAPQTSIRPVAKAKPETRITLGAMPPPDNSVLVQRWQDPEQEPERPKGSTLFGMPKLSHSAKDVLRIQVPRLRKDGETPPSDEASELQVVSKPEVKSKPDARISLGAKTPQKTSTLLQRPTVPSSGAEKSKRTGISNLPIISNFATAILSIRAPKPNPDGKEPKRNGADKSRLASKPVVKSKPDARIKLGAKQQPETSVRIERSEKPGHQSEEPKATGLLGISKVTDFASKLMGLRARKPRTDAKKPAPARAEKSQLASKPKTPTESKATAKPGAKPEAKTEPKARLTLAAKPPQTQSATSQRPKEAEEPAESEVKSAKAGETDDALFHTTSTPAKPAGLIFQPKSESDSVGDALGAKPSSEASPRQSSQPTGRPAASAPRITRHLTAQEQASHTTWEDLTASLFPEGPPPTKQQPKEQEPGVSTASDHEATPSGGATASHEPKASVKSKPSIASKLSNVPKPARKPTSSAKPAPSEKPTLVEKLSSSRMLASRNKPSSPRKPDATAKPDATVKSDTKAKSDGIAKIDAMAKSDATEKSERADKSPVNVVRTKRIRQVVLRMKLAELDPSAAPKSSILDLALPKNKPLLSSLLKANANDQPIVLDSLNRKQMESELDQLEARGAVHIRSEPTLVTVSGRAARFMPTAGPSGTSSGNEPVAVTLLPVLADESRIQLKVTSGNAHTEIVRMRLGQTAVIDVSPADPFAPAPTSQLSSLARILGMKEKAPSGRRLVVLVTPELTRPAQSGSSDLAADHEVTASDDEIRVAERPGTTSR
ncbi:MAG: hypothetical protein HQ582_00020 [Planctomycetes bacterium]|nr:hypothetical protein [Planctomycetota bacterium]